MMQAATPFLVEEVGAKRPLEVAFDLFLWAR